MKLDRLAVDDGCDVEPTCDAMYDTQTPFVVFQGKEITDPDTLSQVTLGAGERLFRVQRDVVRRGFASMERQQ